MKLIILFLISYSAMANFVSQSEIESKKVTEAFVSAEECFKVSGGLCYNITHCSNMEYCKLSPLMIPDKTKPIHSKTEIEACLDQTDCESKNGIKTCSEIGDQVLMAADYSEIYCSRIIRYELKDSGDKHVVIDEDLKAAFDLKVAQEKALEEAMSVAKKVMDCGREVMALLGVRNMAKVPKPTTAEISAVVERFASIKNLMESGSYDTSREQIVSVDITGTILTEDDRAATLAKLDSCVAK